VQTSAVNVATMRSLATSRSA